jgi:hypothetical protein
LAIPETFWGAIRHKGTVSLHLCKSSQNADPLIPVLAYFKRKISLPYILTLTFSELKQPLSQATAQNNEKRNWKIDFKSLSVIQIYLKYFLTFQNHWILLSN